MKQLVDELKKIGILFIVAYAFFQIHYYKESPFTIVRLLVAHFYLFIIPGYCLMLYYLKKIEFPYRVFIGVGLGYALQGILSFLITFLFKINLRSYYLFIPLIIIIIGVYLARKEIPH